MTRDQVVEALESLTFTAIDFETANEDRLSVCAIGMVTVRHGHIQDSVKHLVKPPDMQFSEINMAIHRIRPEDVENAPTFDQLWYDLMDLFEDQLVIAHNSEFDMNVLKQCLDHHCFLAPSMRSLCTMKLSQVAYPDQDDFRLADLAQRLGLPFRHHDCAEDARIAAHIAVDAIPRVSLKKLALDQLDLTSTLTKRASQNKNDRWSAYKDKAVASHLLKPDLSKADPSNPFYGKRIVFTGDLASMSRSEAAKRVQAMGADINTSISRKTQIVVVGAGAGPSKMKKIDDLASTGTEIQILDEDTFIKFLG